MKIRCKPVVVEAYKFTGNREEPGWPRGWLPECWFSADCRNVFFENRIGDEMRALKGEWIVKGANGNFCAVADDDLQRYYESTEMLSEVPAVFLEVEAAAWDLHAFMREMTCEQPSEGFVELTADPEVSPELVKKMNRLNKALQQSRGYREN